MEKLKTVLLLMSGSAIKENKQAEFSEVIKKVRNYLKINVLFGTINKVHASEMEKYIDDIERKIYESVCV